MNIVWIEDFGGNQSAPTQLATLLFKCLSESAGAPFFSDWMTENEELQLTQQSLNNYCSQNIPEHKIILLGNLRSYLDWCAHVDVNRDADIFILDINLTKDDRPELPMPIPAGFEENTDFHKSAGLYIYNDLLARRFPKDKICLMTGEDTTLADFERTCALAFMEPPKNFHKSEGNDRRGPAEFHKWLLNFAHNDLYLRFRRGALDGIGWALADIKQRNYKALHFQRYLYQPDHFNAIEAVAYLNGLSALLPPSSTTGNGSVLKQFLRALVHEWENRTKYGTNTRARQTKSPIFMVLAEVLQLTRNSLTHGRLIDNFSEHDLVIWFILNFRAMFGSPTGDSRGYEQALLRMFKAAYAPNSEADKAISERDTTLRDYLDKIVLKKEHKRLTKDSETKYELKGTDKCTNIIQVSNELSLATPADQIGRAHV